MQRQAFLEHASDGTPLGLLRKNGHSVREFCCCEFVCRREGSSQTKSCAPVYGGGLDRQGIARHAPPCPAALHLDRLALRHDAPLGFCFWRCVYGSSALISSWHVQRPRGSGTQGRCEAAGGCRTLRCIRRAPPGLAGVWRSFAAEDKPIQLSACSRTLP